MGSSVPSIYSPQEQLRAVRTQVLQEQLLLWPQQLLDCCDCGFVLRISLLGRSLHLTISAASTAPLVSLLLMGLQQGSICSIEFMLKASVTQIFISDIPSKLPIPVDSCLSAQGQYLCVLSVLKETLQGIDLLFPMRSLCCTYILLRMWKNSHCCFFP